MGGQNIKGNSKIKNIVKIGKGLLTILTFLVFLSIKTNLKANNIKTIKVNENSLEVVIDPVLFDSNGIIYQDITNKAVLYTPNWPFLKTNRNEDAVEYVAVKNENEEYVIEIKNTNKNEIPLNGLIISVPATMGVSFNIGDVISLNDINASIYKHAILSDKGVRIAFNAVNATSEYNSFTYYNPLYKDKTGTNNFSNNELIVEFDNETNVFKVIGVGKGANNDIPKNGFVISANARPKTYMIDSGVLFNEGDVIELKDLEYVQLEDVITRKYTTINGTRFKDYLVVYPASLNPSLTTNQNIYGCEVAVDSNGLVVEKGVLVNIPEGGFVLSGHGINEKFVKENIFLGSIVTYNTGTKIVTITNNLINQILYNYQVEANVSEELVNTAKDGMYDVNNLERAEANLAIILGSVLEMETLKPKIHNTKNPNDIGEFIRHKKIIEPLFKEVYFDTLVSRRIESRGTWHRPFETSLTLIEETLDELKELNFTDVYLETFWYGYTIYKSELAPYHVIFDEVEFGEYKDYLDAFIGEAKKRNINVHAWVQNFYVGPTWYHSLIWEEHPEWRIVDINGSNVITGKPEKDEENLLFFDPANPEVREFLKEIYKEIIEYNVTGLHLDYIRYPSGNEYPEYSTGYTEYATSEFKELYNVTGDIKILVKTEPTIYTKWNEYRLSKITSLVEEIHTIIREKDSKLILSMAVGPNAAYSKVNIMQDWRGVGRKRLD
ncbi:MAG: glycoside hydrolase family 10 protein [Acholeplasmatales bacterium]